jgi:gamma-glutamylcyclotransferase (GGCT)/AIG2-like uncharacterized protein YtfP
MRFFFYGTLMDADIRRAVLADRAPESTEPATLAGYRRVAAANGAYPILVKASAYEVDGVVVRGLDKVAQARLNRYEGPEYELRDVDVATREKRALRVLVYVPSRDNAPRVSPGPWKLDMWQRRFKRELLALIKMGLSATSKR